MIVLRRLEDINPFIELIKDKSSVIIFGNHEDSKAGANVPADNAEVFQIAILTDFDVCYWSEMIFKTDIDRLNIVRKLYENLNPIPAQFLRKSQNLEFIKIN